MKRPKPQPTGRRASKAIGAPPMPEPSELEAAAAGSEPSAAGAWWISAQVVDHMFRSIGERDRRTGVALPGSLQDLLAALRGAGEGGRRPFPKDVLAEAADVADEVVADLLHEHRTRVVREHVQLPFPSLREVDGRSLAWLARQPGRNVREKLAGRTHALGVRRSPSADTAENRLVRAFAASLVRRGRERLLYRDAYDAGGVDDERAEKLAAALRICNERMRRSELADVPARVPTRVNNVLLSDPRYATVFRSWRRLREAEEGLAEAWSATPHRIAVALFWSVAAELVSRSGVLLWDRPAFVVDAGGLVPLSKHGEVGIDLLLEADERAGPRRLRLKLADGFLLAELATLEGRGLLTPGPPERLSFELCLRPRPDEARRGAVLEVDGAGEAPADLEGLRFLADRLAERILSTARTWRPPRPPPHAPSWPTEGPIGIELADTRVSVDAGGPVAVATRGWACAWALEGGSAEAWLDGRADRVVEVGEEGTRVFAIGVALEPDEADAAGLLGLTARRIADAIAMELPVGSRIAYTLPDAGEAFSQRTLRVALDAAFGDAKPVWRSVAAAVDWQAQPGCPIRPGEQLLVVDVEFTGVCPTLLVAKHDGKLAHALPSSQGIYWERKPSFSEDEARDGLGWRRVLENYAEELVRRALRSINPSPDRVRNIAGCIVRTRGIATLVEEGGTRLVGIDGGLLELQHDSRGFGEAVDRWLWALREALVPVRDSLPPNVTTYVLLVGGPGALEGFSAHALPLLARHLGTYVDWAPARALAAGASACRARIDASLPVWKEWLPDLWLEVVRDGHYAELALLDKDTLVDPFLGGEQHFDVPERLVLAAGKPWYSFPLILGRKDHRPLAWEARVVSPTFPLAADVRVRLRLSYAYGMESTYALALEPVGEAPFERLHAHWSRVGEDRVAALLDDAPRFVSQGWSTEKSQKFLEVADGVARGSLQRGNFGGFAFGVTRECWAQGRSAAAAPPAVKAHLSRFIEVLSKGYDPAALTSGSLAKGFEVLCQLHEDAPAEVRRQALALDQAAGDDPYAFARTAPLLIGLVGDGRGERRQVLERLVFRARRAAEAYNLGLARRVARALGAALMRHPGLINAVPAPDGEFLIEFGRRSLTNLQRQVPVNAPLEDRERVMKLFSGPYSEWTELLLMLLPLRAASAGAALRRGTASADALAKAVRQIDARFVRMGIDPRWRIHLGVPIPDALRRMSLPAYTLCTYLSESGAENLAEVTGADAE